MILGAIHMRIQKRSVTLAILLVVLVISVSMAGCTGTVPPPGPSTTQPTPTPGGNSVAIRNFEFNPQTLTVAMGTTVTWVNQDSPEHQVVNDASGTTAEGAIFKSNPLTNGASYSFTFATAGTYPYHCSIHPSMKGTIVVT